MTFIQHEEARRARRIFYWGCFIFVISAHTIRGLSYTRTASSGGGGLGEVFSGSFWGSIHYHAIRPLNEFRLTIGDFFSSATGLCPDPVLTPCEKGIGIVRMVLGLHA